ncbi:YadA-like family protein [Bartonella bacilliformis]|uniref:Immunodominant surface antigen, Brp family n=2 Tax=Bartonella bacilliformis TaxID=774 RepID=A1URM8_BARBK|nr:YadA-like family protein [Bartonella bacilliformis]ABM44517.1 immunodominant surface antigen, Brp family [Bartonella bacilliformis KC583]AMG85482.1 hypothetical protein AL467_01540 [Bartonella bacilliformis]EKS45750.1 Brp family immunodominant surface antigen [Bartonella bacilliformis INS]EYS90230.1 hypothetical protein X472_00686 [Bartonella bacilliformis San Pedro600-02]KZN22045.1 hypothetical protein A6B38_03055 [Bartonella bacilliformis]
MKEIQPQRGAVGCVLVSYFWLKRFLGIAIAALLSTILPAEGQPIEHVTLSEHNGVPIVDGAFELQQSSNSGDRDCRNMNEVINRLSREVGDGRVLPLELEEKYCETIVERLHNLGDSNGISLQALNMIEGTGVHKGNSGKFKVYSVGLGHYSGVLGVGAATAVNAFGAQAYGFGARAMAPATIAVGIGADAQNMGAVAVGGIASAKGKNSLALGPQTLAYSDGSVAIGGDPDSEFGARALATNSLSMGAKSYTGENSEAAIAVGLGAQVRDGSPGGVALGWGAFVAEGAEGGLALGRNSHVDVNQGVALGVGSRVNTPAGVAGYDPRSNDETKNTNSAWKSRYGAVSVGDAERDITRQITGVAAGTQNTDAVNVAQLQALRDATVLYNRDEDGNKTNKIALQGGDPSQPVALDNLADGNVTEGSKQAVNGGQLYDFMQVQTDYTKEQTRRVLKDAKGYTDKKFNALSYEIDGARKEARQGAAIGLAVSNLRYDDTPGSLSLAFGTGMWRHQYGFAVGAGFMSVDGKVSANVSAATAGGHWGVGAGVSVTLN